MLDKSALYGGSQAVFLLRTWQPRLPGPQQKHTRAAAGGETLIEAIPTIRAIHLLAKEDRILSLLEQRQQLESENPEVLRLALLFSSKSV